MTLSDLRLLLADDRRRGLLYARRWHIEQYLAIRAARSNRTA